MNSFLITTQIISIVITLFGVLSAVKKPAVYIKYFHGFYSVVMALTLGPLFWNLGIYAVDKILISNMEIDAYQALFEHIRKVIFPAGVQPFLMLLQLLLLAAMHRKAKKAEAH